MNVGNLDVQVITEKTGPKLLVVGRIHGVETPVTADELRSLAAYLQRVADAAKEEECTPKV